jgi:hypothetical protein
MEIKKLLLTPTIAKQYLESNVNNRNVKNRLVTQYANDMINGRWKIDTGETIKISKSGTILDGQHRLLAVIKANLPVYFHIVTDLEESVFDVLDTGSKRNASDVFKIKGAKMDNTLPSIISFYNMLHHGRKYNRDKKGDSTNSALLEQYLKDEQFWYKLGLRTMSWYDAFAKILPPSFIGGFYAYLIDKNEIKAYEFMNQLCTGINIQNDTIYMLRNKLMQDKMSIRKMDVNVRVALVIKTWNSYIKNQNIKILKFDHIREEFPEAINF